MIILNAFLNKIQKIRISCYLAAKVLDFINPYVKVGVSTYFLDKLCNFYITKIQNAFSACLGYQGFPKSICVSINHIVCHGIPNKNIILKNGDIINIDVAVKQNGFYGDTSKMFLIGNVNLKYKYLCYITQQSLYLAIKTVKPGIYINCIGHTIQNYIKKTKFSIVREYCGHGIGEFFHKSPYIFHYSSNSTCMLKKGMIFTIEPIINFGKKDVYTHYDGWAVKTIDKSFSAQYEHTILVTDNGCEIMTLRKDESLSKFIIH